jgi:hypothetical protein
VLLVMQPLVQRFLELVLASQYHYRFRWNKQSELGMLWQMFVPAEQLSVLPFTGFFHPRKEMTC